MDDAADVCGVDGIADFEEQMKKPFPVATLPPLPAKGSISLSLPDTSEKLFANVPRLAVTFEPVPANPGETMRGEPVLAGHCVKLW